MPDWIRDVLRVVLLFAFPITVFVACGMTYVIAAFGGVRHLSQMSTVCGLWAVGAGGDILRGDLHPVAQKAIARRRT